MFLPACLIFAILFFVPAANAQDSSGVRGIGAIYRFYSGLISDIQVSGNYAYVATDSAGLVVLNVANPANPIQVGSVSFRVAITSLRIDGSRLYAGCGTAGIRVLDVTNPSTPTLIGTLATGFTSTSAILSRGNLVLVKDRYFVRLIDVSTPNQPRNIGNLNFSGHGSGGGIMGFTLKDSLLLVSDTYLTGSSGSGYVTHAEFSVLNIANPATIDTLYYEVRPAADFGLLAAGTNRVYDARSATLVELNLANPRAPATVRTCQLEFGPAANIKVGGNYALVSVDHTIYVYDYSRTDSMVFRSSIDIESMRNYFVTGNYLYVTRDYFGVAIYDLTNIASPLYVGHFGNDHQVRGLAMSGNTAVLAGGYTGLEFVDCSDQSRPAVVNTMSTSGYATDVAVYQNRAYVLAGSLRVYDISNVRAPSFLFSAMATYTAVTTTLQVTSNYIYVCAQTNGFQIYGRSDTDPPSRLGSYLTTGAVAGATVESGIAYLAKSSDGLSIVNISTPSTPTLINRFTYTGNQTLDVAKRGTLLYIVDRDLGLYIVDVSNVNAPQQVGHCNLPTRSHRIVLSGNYAYIASEVGGIRVINIANSTNPYEVGFYRRLWLADKLQVAGTTVFLSDIVGFGIFDCVQATSVIERAATDLPATFSLHPNFPNPFNASTAITYSIPKTSEVSLKLFDTFGREVALLANFTQHAGTYTVKLDDNKIASGTYFVHLRAGNYSQTRKLTLLR